MAKFKQRSLKSKSTKNKRDHESKYDELAASRFGVSAQTLMKMVEERNSALLHKELGGCQALCSLLHTDAKRGILNVPEQPYEEVIAARHQQQQQQQQGDAFVSVGDPDDPTRIEQSLELRRKAFGANKFKYPPPKSFFYLMFRACQEITVLILAIAATVSLTIGLAVEENRNEYGYIEGLAIVIVLIIIVMVQASIDYSKEKKFRHLNSVKDNYNVHVVRNAQTVQLPMEELVVGDIMKVSAGDKIAADCVIVDFISRTLKTNESAMTGEVVDVNKSLEQDSFLVSGTTVSEGAGVVVVVAAGESSQWGIILSELIQEPDETPLQERLDKLALLLGKFGILVAFLTFMVSLFRWIATSVDSGHWNGTEVLTALINSIAIVLVALPEGLPLAITLSLAFAMKKLIKENNLVRVLSACETMGSATQLNADKTGTLTQNRMTVVEAFLGEQWFVYPGANDEAKTTLIHELGDSTLPANFKKLTALSVSVNSQANLHKKPDGRMDHLGSKTECALLQLVEDWGMNYHHLREANPAVDVFLFNSTRKRMSAIIPMPAEDVIPAGIARTALSNNISRVDSIDSTVSSWSTAGQIPDGNCGGGRLPKNTKYQLHCKGAPEILVDLCSSRMDMHGTVLPMELQDREVVLEAVKLMASQGLRTLMLCYRDNIKILDDTISNGYGRNDKSPITAEEWEDLERDMVLLGVVGIKDPIRPETKDAVALLRKAGVVVRMVTGDNAITARFIAEEAGILDGCEGPDAVLEGPVFRNMSPEERSSVALNLRVLARSSPTDKLLLVREHKRLGEVVAVTGDGTNDAPALKEADVGFALGLAGTEVAKEACDIVILDDNISSMAKAVLWGRNVYMSIRKFLQFQLVVNIVAVSVDFVAACAGVPLPLGAVALLWVNVAMDSCAALALATEPPNPSLMDKKPFGRHAPLVNRAMIRNIAGASIFQFTVAMVLQFAGRQIFNIPCFDSTWGNPENEPACYGSTLELNSLIFNTFVFMQIFNEINCRRIEEKNVLHNIWKSPLFCIILALTIGGQIGIMVGIGATRIGEKIGIVTITGPMWAVSVVLGVMQLAWGYLVRFYPLEWCIGADDEDVTDMSKLEELIHWKSRKPRVIESMDVEPV